jgi:hypothetical protein
MLGLHAVRDSRPLRVELAGEAQVVFKDKNGLQAAALGQAEGAEVRLKAAQRAGGGESSGAGGSDARDDLDDATSVGVQLLKSAEAFLQAVFAVGEVQKKDGVEGVEEVGCLKVGHSGSSG